MKYARFLPLLGLASVFLSAEARGALLNGVGQNPASPYYADFATKGLDVRYSFSGGTGTISVSNHLGGAKSGEGYTSKELSPGTQGNGHPGVATAFTGYYFLTATVTQVAGQWQVASGNFSIDGSLFGGNNQDLLLTGTLKTGAQTFGFDSSLKELEFLFTTGSSGNSSILADFFGAGAGNGAILLNWGSAAIPGFSLTSNWQNTGDGFADTFVPEPVFYPFAAVGTAMFGLVLARRKPGCMSLVGV